jgi:hypothetical protein
MQMLPSTWSAWSKEVYGEVRNQTPSNERYVGYIKIEKWLAEGHSPREIALIWNQGHPGKCRAGVNKLGVEYNSCAYAQKILAFLDV